MERKYDNVKDKLKNFILCIRNIPTLKRAFIACKDLEESYEKFKIMLNGSTLQEYKQAFEELIKDKSLLSDEDLLRVAGGLNISKLAAPLAIMTMLTGGANFSFASASEPTKSVSLSAPYEQSLDWGNSDTSERTTNNDSEANEDSPHVSEAEIEFGLKIIQGMPKKGEPNFENFLKLPNQSKLNTAREITVNYKNAPSEIKTINEKEIYKEIEKTVKEIIAKSESRTPGENMTEDEIKFKIAEEKLSKHYKKPKQMRIAKAIYRWVIKNIKVDFDSDTSDPENRNFRKGQDAISVFYHKMAVCQGYSRLINLMMKMAGIPSAYVESGYHAFNVIYLENESGDKGGWALVEPTWAAQLAQGNIEKSGWDVRMFFPAFYSSSDSLKEANREILKHDDHHVMDISTGTDLDGNLDDEYWYTFKIDNVSYNLFGMDGEGLIAISGDYSHPIENLVISEEISSLNLPFRINSGIKSIILSGNERLVGTDAASGADDLEFIQFGDIKCGTDLDMPYIWSDTDKLTQNVHIPETLLNLNTSIQIGSGIGSIVLTGNQVVDLSYAFDLKNVDATASNKYMVENGKLYAKTALGGKGDQIIFGSEHFVSEKITID